jgi:hypothetical protein
MISSIGTDLAPFHDRHTSSTSPPSLLLMDNRSCFLGLKWLGHEDDLSPPSSAKGKTA